MKKGQRARRIGRLLHGRPTTDGAGVKLVRVFAHGQSGELDPFLMLDEFSSYDAGDYLAGFPSHPHRGFETVTYMLDGHMQHEDHLGNRGDLKSGDVQWMTAGRGIIHSEMPQQHEGRMRGFQLWINLPAAEKMKPASYRDIPAVIIPVVHLDGGISVKVIAGEITTATGSVCGPIGGLSTEPVYFDIDLPPQARCTLPLPATHNAFVYVFEGAIAIAGAALTQGVGAVLDDGEIVTLEGDASGGRLLLLAGKPIGEPVVQHGPFVMNTAAEIRQAITDYQSGRLTG
ncbi:MAG: pirin family protein [Gammaproteobacteria bacterium]|nr:pirin family protein [Gammaproteobacteria bacterium]